MKKQTKTREQELFKALKSSLEDVKKGNFVVLKNCDDKYRCQYVRIAELKGIKEGRLEALEDVVMKLKDRRKINAVLEELEQEIAKLKEQKIKGDEK